jgi:hypothetical protein
MSRVDYLEKEPTWVIKPKGGYGLEAGGDYGNSDGSGYTLWYVTYADKGWVEFEEEFDGNTLGVKVGDFMGVPVGGLTDIDNFEYGIDVAEEELGAEIKLAKEEFGA